MLNQVNYHTFHSTGTLPPHQTSGSAAPDLGCVVFFCFGTLFIQIRNRFVQLKHLIFPIFHTKVMLLH